MNALGKPEPPAVRYSEKECEEANEAWGFNCGPGAICGVLSKTPAELRPHMLDFPVKGYTNPRLMYAVLRSLGVKFTVSCDPLGKARLGLPTFGLARIQWDGPWCNPGVPMAARYRKTHWIGVWTHPGLSKVKAIFDVNVGYWTDRLSWETKLVPALLDEAVPKASGLWWPTHSIEVIHG